MQALVANYTSHCVFGAVGWLVGLWEECGMLFDKRRRGYRFNILFKDFLFHSKDKGND